MMLKLKLQYLATSCKELTHWKRPWCWGGLGLGGEGDDRGWDGWMASPTWWSWVWVNSGSWWWTGRPGVLWFMGSQRVRHDWATELNWTDELLAWVSPQVRSWATFLFVSILGIWAFVSFGHFANLVLMSVYNSDLFMLGKCLFGTGTGHPWRGFVIWSASE